MQVLSTWYGSDVDTMGLYTELQYVVYNSYEYKDFMVNTWFLQENSGRAYAQKMLWS